MPNNTSRSKAQFLVEQVQQSTCIGNTELSRDIHDFFNEQGLGKYAKKFMELYNRDDREINEEVIATLATHFGLDPRGDTVPLELWTDDYINMHIDAIQKSAEARKQNDPGLYAVEQFVNTQLEGFKASLGNVKKLSKAEANNVRSISKNSFPGYGGCGRRQ